MERERNEGEDWDIKVSGSYFLEDASLALQEAKAGLRGRENKVHGKEK